MTWPCTLSPSQGSSKLLQSVLCSSSSSSISFQAPSESARTFSSIIQRRTRSPGSPNLVKVLTMASYKCAFLARAPCRGVRLTPIGYMVQRLSVYGDYDYNYYRNRSGCCQILSTHKESSGRPAHCPSHPSRLYHTSDRGATIACGRL